MSTGQGTRHGFGFGLGLPGGCLIGCLGLIAIFVILGAFMAALKPEPQSNSAPSRPTQMEPVPQAVPPPHPQSDKYVIVKSDWDAEGCEYNEITKPSEGNFFGALLVTVTNHGNGSVPVNPLYFTITINGVTYNEGFVPVKRPLPCCDLANGATVTGHIGFELPRAGIGQPTTLRFEPMVLFEDFRVRYE